MAALAGAGGAQAQRPVDDAPALLPDLDQRAPSDISIRRIGLGAAARDVLAFTARVENVGQGSLILNASRASADAPSMAVEQGVTYGDGTMIAFGVAGEMRFEPGGHSHWHLLEFMVYELRDAATGTLVRPDQKTGFCVGDRYRSNTNVPNRPPRAVMTQECGRNDPGILRFVSGLSPGFGEIYEPIVEGQYIDVTRLAAGRYVLVHRSNSTRALRESEFGNNDASVLLQLSHPRGSGDVPAVSVLRTCEQSAQCPTA